MTLEWEIREEEPDLLWYWEVLKKHKGLIILATFLCALSTAVFSLLVEDIYRSQAVIIPISGEKSSLGTIASRMGAMAGLLGISPLGTSEAEIVSLLKSEVLKEELIKRYNLLPVLFSERWEPESRTWKPPPFGPGLILSRLMAKVRGGRCDPDAPPTVWDGIKKLEEIVEVRQDPKLGTIRVSVDFPDPQRAAEICQALITTLREHMCAEAIRVAQTNKRYLEEELVRTSDPLIRQKIYALIADQVETITMAKVKENFAFKVIDPPRVPEEKVKPRRAMMVAVAFVLGGFVGVMGAFLIEAVEKAKRERATRKGNSTVGS